MKKRVGLIRIIIGLFIIIIAAYIITKVVGWLGRQDKKKIFAFVTAIWVLFQRLPIYKLQWFYKILRLFTKR